MKLRPTALGVRGAVFFATVTLLFFATPYSNLFFLLTAFLAVLGAIGILGCRRNLRELAVELRAAHDAPAGSGHDVEVVLHAGKRTHFGIAVSLVTDHGVHLLATTPVVRGELVVQGRVPGLARGIHAVRSVRLGSVHPFGLCRAQLDVPANSELVAYPAPASVPGADAWAGLGEGQRALAAIGSDAVACLREFRPGDRLRDVHWRATARRSTPVVKEREREADEGLALLLDRRLPPDRFELALGQASALLLRAATRHCTVELRSQGHAAVYGEGREPWADAFRWLAGVAPLPADGAAAPACSPDTIRLPLQGAEPRGA